MQVTHIHSCRIHFSVGVWTFSDSLIVQNVRIPQWHSLCFIFLWTLTGVPAVSYITRLPSFRVNCHAIGEAGLTWKPSLLRPPKVPLMLKMFFPVHKKIWRMLGLREILEESSSLCGRKSVSLFSQVAPHLEAPAARQRGSGGAEG